MRKTRYSFPVREPSSASSSSGLASSTACTWATLAQHGSAGLVPSGLRCARGSPPDPKRRHASGSAECSQLGKSKRTHKDKHDASLKARKKSCGSDHGRHPLARPLRLGPSIGAETSVNFLSSPLHGFCFSQVRNAWSVSLSATTGWRSAVFLLRLHVSGIAAASTAQEAPRQHGLGFTKRKRHECTSQGRSSAFKARAPRSKSSAGQADEMQRLEFATAV